MLWIPIFLKQWKRKQNRLAFQWGTIGDVLLEGPRPTFRGKHMQTDPITKNLTPVYPIYKTWLREYGVSLPIVLFSLGIAFHVMCIYFRLEEQLIIYYDSNPIGIQKLIVLMPGIIYAVIVMIMNHMYRQIATKLNEWGQTSNKFVITFLKENVLIIENHRTQTSHENHWIIKLVLVLLNNFMSLFYIAFYLKDIQMLKWVCLTIYCFANNYDSIMNCVTIDSNWELCLSSTNW